MNTNELFRLDGRVALVTGGAGLYGVHITRALAEVGAHVVIASRNKDQCEKVSSEMKAEGLRVSAAHLDLGSSESITRLCEDIVSQFGQLDILFNNAVARAGGDPSTVTEEEWETAMRINSTGFFLSCKIFGEQMREQPRVNDVRQILGLTCAKYVQKSLNPYEVLTGQVAIG